jgi:hypothetical protein
MSLSLCLPVYLTLCFCFSFLSIFPHFSHCFSLSLFLSRRLSLSIFIPLFSVYLTLFLSVSLSADILFFQSIPHCPCLAVNRFQLFLSKSHSSLFAHSGPRGLAKAIFYLKHLFFLNYVEHNDNSYQVLTTALQCVFVKA